MTITTFQKSCTVGSMVQNMASQEEGRVLKISKDHDKALVHYSDGSKAWTEYYLLQMID